jgi:hypothetical protein
LNATQWLGQEASKTEHAKDLSLLKQKNRKFWYLNKKKAVDPKQTEKKNTPRTIRSNLVIEIFFDFFVS